jgi:hypothetical protein
MIDAVHAFLQLPTRRVTQDERLAALSRALDQLAAAYHQTPEVEPSERVQDPPDRGDYREIRRSMAEAFPEFSVYPVGDVAKDVSAGDAMQALIGDAIDDLADITRDLQEVTWRWENVGLDDAAWHFRFGYEIHWGRHLHNLRSYVHFKQFGN